MLNGLILASKQDKEVSIDDIKIIIFRENVFASSRDMDLWIGRFG